MTEKVSKFSFFESFWDAASDLDDKSRLALYDAICEYAFTGCEPDFEGIMSTIWKLVKPNIDSSIKGQRTGGKGGRPTKEKPPVKEAENPPFCNSKTPSETDMDMDMDKEGDMDMDGREFVPTERTNSLPESASTATAAACAAPPPRKDPKPLCPMCEVPVWKNTQTRKYRCDSCGDDWDEGKVEWR